MEVEADPEHHGAADDDDDGVSAGVGQPDLLQRERVSPQVF